MAKYKDVIKLPRDLKRLTSDDSDVSPYDNAAYIECYPRSTVDKRGGRFDCEIGKENGAEEILVQGVSLVNVDKSAISNMAAIPPVSLMRTQASDKKRGRVPTSIGIRLNDKKSKCYIDAILPEKKDLKISCFGEK